MSGQVQQFLVSTLIVRDEEEMLPGCLDSISTVVDQIIVNDTGSSDRTIELALARNAVVIKSRWERNFALARNQALAHPHEAEWVLCIDADERLTNSDSLRQALQAVPPDIDAVAIEVHSSRNGGGVTSLWSPRIFRAGRFRFEGALHERPVRISDGATLAIAPLHQVSILHLGYLDEVSTAKRKAERNFRIAREAYERNHSPKTASDLARSQALLGRDLDQAVALINGLDPAALSSVEHADLLAITASIALQMGDIQAAYIASRRALELSDDDTALAVFAKSANLLDRGQELIAVSESIGRRPPSLFSVPSNRYIFSGLVAAALAKAGQWERAVSLAQIVLSERPDLFEGWEPFLDGSRSTETVQSLIALDPQANWLPVSVRQLPVSSTAEICIAYLDRGGTANEAIGSGILAAMLSSQWHLVDRFALYLHRLPRNEADRIIERFLAKGHRELAERISSQLTKETV